MTSDDVQVQGSKSFEELATRMIAETTLDAVVYANREGIIELWNKAAEDMFGIPADYALGESLDIIIPEKHQRDHWDGWKRVLKTGKTNYGIDPLAAPSFNADGKRLSLEFSIIMLKDDDGEIEGIGAILRDVTKDWNKRKELEKELQDAKLAANKK